MKFYSRSSSYFFQFRLVGIVVGFFFIRVSIYVDFSCNHLQFMPYYSAYQIKSCMYTIEFIHTVAIVWVCIGAKESNMKIVARTMRNYWVVVLSIQKYAWRTVQISILFAMLTLFVIRATIWRRREKKGKRQNTHLAQCITYQTMAHSDIPVCTLNMKTWTKAYFIEHFWLDTVFIVVVWCRFLALRLDIMTHTLKQYNRWKSRRLNRTEKSMRFVISFCSMPMAPNIQIRHLLLINNSMRCAYVLYVLASTNKFEQKTVSTQC